MPVTTSRSVRHAQTVEEFEIALGGHIRSLRLRRNLDQISISAQAGVSVRALRNLEARKGSSVSTLVAIVRALGREEWIDAVNPGPTINPLTLPVSARERQRATSKPKSSSTFDAASKR